MPNLIHFLVDRLHRNFVGAYGNTWIHTPALDRLAFESAVFDQHLVECPDPAKVSQAVWTGSHPLTESPPEVWLPEVLRAERIETILFCDDLTLVPAESLQTFDRVIQPEVPPRLSQRTRLRRLTSFRFLPNWSMPRSVFRHPLPCG